MNGFGKAMVIIFVGLSVIFGCSSKEEKKASHYSRGSVYFAEGEYKNAELELKSAIQFDPDFAKAYEKLGETYLKRKMANKAYDAFSNAAKLDPNNMHVRSRLATILVLGKKTGDAKEQLGAIPGKEPDNTEAELKKAVAAVPTDVKSYVALFSLYAGRKDYVQAEAALDKAIANNPDDVGVMSTLAKFHLKNNNLEQAEKLTQKVLSKQPDYFNGRILKGELLVTRKEYSAAIFLFDQLIADDPKSEDAHYGKALAHVGRKERPLAISELMKTLDINPKNLHAKLMLADAYLQDHVLDAAATQIKGVLEAAPTDYQARLILGNIRLEQKKIDQAEQIFIAMVSDAPERPVGYFRLGMVYSQKKQYDKALSALDAALSLAPGYMEAFVSMVQVLDLQGNIGAAMEKCDDFINVVHDSPTQQAMVLSLKGDLFFKHGKKVDAEKAYKEALVKDPNFMKSYHRLARLYMYENKQDDAIVQCKAALARNPKEKGFHMLIGTVYESKKQLAEAEKHYRAELENNPGYVPALNNLSCTILARGGNADEALSLARKAKEIAPGEAIVMDTLGCAYLKKKFYDSAISEFNASLAVMPNNAMVHYHLGQALVEKGDIPGAKTAFEKALSINPSLSGAADAKQKLSEL